MARNLPGPRGLWFVGSLPELRAGMLPFFERCRRDYGTAVRIRFGPQRTILLSDPDAIEEVLVSQNKHFRKHYATRLLAPVLGQGLLLSEGSQWLRQRRLVQPAFSRSFTEEFASIVRLHASRLAQNWQTEPRRDLYHDMTQLTVQIAAHAFLGVSSTQETEEIGACLEVIHTDFEYRFQSAWTFPAWVPTPRNRRLRDAVRRLTAIIDRMIKQRRGESSRGHDALSLMLHAVDEEGLGMSQQLLRDEVMTLLLAGHDTTANGLTWTWSLLAMHPEVFARLQQELQAERAEVREINSLPYTLQVVKESMRLFPPVYMFGREALRDISIADFTVRKGESVVMSQWIMHRDERFYAEPLQFRPERWTPEFERELPKYAYLPFGGGPRVCIGKEVAMLEAVSVLATLARGFRVKLESAGELRPWPTVTLRPPGPVWAQVEPLQDSAKLDDSNLRPPEKVANA